MFILSLAVTILLGYFLPGWMYDTQWSTLIKIATQEGDVETWKELGQAISISQETAQKYLFTVIGLCVLIFIICMCITGIIKKALKKKETNK